jgi:hypothetical protein
MQDSPPTMFSKPPETAKSLGELRRQISQHRSDRGPMRQKTLQAWVQLEISSQDSMVKVKRRQLNNPGSVNTTTLSGHLARTNLLALESGVFVFGAPFQYRRQDVVTRRRRGDSKRNRRGLKAVESAENKRIASDVQA